MILPRTPTDPGQLTLGVRVRRAPVGRYERRMAAACRLRRREGALAAADDGLIALAVGLARQLDVCEAAGLPYAIAQVGRVLADVEAQLAARAGGTGTDFDAWLRSMSGEEPHPTQ